MAAGVLRRWGSGDDCDDLDAGREQSSGRGDFFSRPSSTKDSSFSKLGKEIKGGREGGSGRRVFPLLLFFSSPPTWVWFRGREMVFCKMFDLL